MTTALVVLVAVLAALTLLPALLALLGPRIDALALPWKRSDRQATEHRDGARADGVEERPNVWARVGPRS